MNNIIINVDTDSILISKPDQTAWTKAEQSLFLESLNSQFPDKISFEHDGIFSSVVIVKAKNYALLPEATEKDPKPKIKLKGSSIKDQKKEPALREMMDAVIRVLIMDEDVNLIDIYHKYIKEAMNPQNVRRWCQKKSVSESVLSCKGYEGMADDDEDSPRKNETDVWDAIKAEEGLQQGDKIYVYPVSLGMKSFEEKHFKKNKTTGEKEFVGYRTKEKEVFGLRLDKYYKNDIATDKLVKRVYDTMKIFESVIDITQFPKYHNKSNKELLEKLINE